MIFYTNVLINKTRQQHFVDKTFEVFNLFLLLFFIIFRKINMSYNVMLKIMTFSAAAARIANTISRFMDNSKIIEYKTKKIELGIKIN
jgi:hypothetical protein